MASSRGVRAALVTVLAATALSACGGGDATSAEVLQERTEQIGRSVLAEIADVPRAQEDDTATNQQWVDAEANGEDPDAERWIEWEAVIEIAPGAGVTPEQAATTIATALQEDGWTEVRPHAESRYGYELGRDDDLGAGWYARIAYDTEPPPMAQGVGVLIVSPVTTTP